jgi:type I restriction enzyme S subunit
MIGCLQNLSDLRATHAARNATLRQTRDLLLPRLVSGELDVAELEIEMGELEG